MGVLFVYIGNNKFCLVCCGGAGGGIPTILLSFVIFMFSFFSLFFVLYTSWERAERYTYTLFYP